MIRQRPVELLAPAKNIACGIEAIRHGADAVYIGASRFGARAAAGNSVEDIARLVDFAHQFRARVYVTVNTILKGCPDYSGYGVVAASSATDTASCQYADG